MKKCLQNMNVRNKRVVLRLDLNVPMQNGVILDDAKIRDSLETIFYLLQENCRIVILSHFGKVKTQNDKLRYSLEKVSLRLKELVGQEVYFSKENFGEAVVKRVQIMKPKEILMLENTRFMDLPNKLESKCDAQLSLFWASLGDVFVNDAFATSHRKHASTYGISLYLPSCIGFAMQKEISSLDRLILHPIHPFTVIMGGAKIDDKITLIESLLPKCEHLLCGGGIANTCLEALGFETGQSISSTDPIVLDKVKKILLQYKDKILLPLDAIVGSTYDKSYVKYKLINEIDENDMILDIGAKTLQRYEEIIHNSETVFLNGTVGLYEDMRFANGTKELLRIITESKAVSVCGGGDASSSVRNFGYGNKFTYISSGGGATLEYIATGNLAAIEAIKEEMYIETLDM